MENILSVIRSDEEYMTKRAKWNLYWMAFRGIYYNRLTKKYEEDVAVNNLKKVVTTLNWFLFGESGAQPFFNEGTKGVQMAVQQVLDYANFPAICNDIGSDASIYGDAFVKLGYEELEADDPRKVKYGLKNGIINMKVVDPAIVYPKLSTLDKDKVEYYVIDYTTDQYTYTEIHHKDRIEIYNNDSLVMEHENPLNEFLIVHVPNYRNTKSFYGLSDFEDVFLLNREIVAKVKDLSDIIDYHGSPITLLFGVKRQDLIKGARRVWSGLPKDAKVENLQLDTDLESINNFIKLLDDKVWELADIPEIARGKKISISNTSSAAMKMMYYPLIQKAGRKKILLTPAVKDIIWLVMSLLEAKGEIELPTNPMDFRIEYPSPFPQDELIAMSVIERRKALGMITKRKALEYIGETDIDRIIEILGEEFPVEEDGVNHANNEKQREVKDSYYSELQQESDPLYQDTENIKVK